MFGEQFHQQRVRATTVQDDDRLDPSLGNFLTPYGLLGIETDLPGPKPPMAPESASTETNGRPQRVKMARYARSCLL